MICIFCNNLMYDYSPSSLVCIENECKNKPYIMLDSFNTINYWAFQFYHNEVDDYIIECWNATYSNYNKNYSSITSIDDGCLLLQFDIFLDYPITKIDASIIIDTFLKLANYQ